MLKNIIELLEPINYSLGKLSSNDYKKFLTMFETLETYDEQLYIIINLIDTLSIEIPNYNQNSRFLRKYQKIINNYYEMLDVNGFNCKKYDIELKTRLGLN